MALPAAVERKVAVARCWWRAGSRGGRLPSRKLLRACCLQGGQPEQRLRGALCGSGVTRAEVAEQGGQHWRRFLAEHRRDVDELPKYLLEGIDIHFAKKYEDVYKVAFGEVQGPVAKGESTSAVIGESKAEAEAAK